MPMLSRLILASLASFVAAASKPPQLTDSNTLVLSNIELDLNNCQRDFSIFDSAFYDYEHSQVVSRQTGTRIPVNVFRSSQEGYSILFARDDAGVISYLKITPPGVSSPMYFYTDSTSGELVEFELPPDMHLKKHCDAIAAIPAAIKPVIARRRRGDNHRRHLQSDSFVYERGDGDSDECTEFKIISIAVAYDYEFCQLHRGSDIAAGVAIETIVAAASDYYEKDLCTRLQLTSITPDATCDGSTTYFGAMTKGTCGEPGYLADFSTFMASTRSQFGIDASSLVYLFSGAPQPTDIRGCAWQPGLCSLEFGYGVLYNSANHPDPIQQSLLFAHEVAHNLNAKHDTASAGVGDTILQEEENDGSDGFSQPSVDAMLDYIDRASITCDAVEIVPTLAPRPMSMPSGAPSMAQPSFLPTPTPPSPIAATFGPTPDDGLVCNVGPQTHCVVASGLNNDYACFEKTSLIETLSVNCNEFFEITFNSCLAVDSSMPENDAPQEQSGRRRGASKSEKATSGRRIRALKGRKRKRGKGKSGDSKDDKSNDGDDSSSDDKEDKSDDDDGSDDGDDDDSSSSDDGDDNDSSSSDDGDGDDSSSSDDGDDDDSSSSSDDGDDDDDSGDGDGDDDDDSGDGDDDDDQPSATPAPTFINTANPAPTSAPNGDSDRAIRFSSADCDSPCIEVGDFVCVNAEQARVVRTFFEVRDSMGNQEDLSSLIAILPDDNPACVPPVATCFVRASTSKAGTLESEAMGGGLEAAAYGK